MRDKSILGDAKKAFNSYSFSKNKYIEVDDTLRKIIQDSLLEMATDIFTTAKRNNLDVFLVGGSALGAVRHGGFIPWDDDMDIGMTREAFQKFVEVFDEELGEKYILNAPNYSNQVIARFPKVLKKDTIYATDDTEIEELQKLYIDIFLLDSIPDNRIVRKVYGTYCNICEFVASCVLMTQSKGSLLNIAMRETNTKAYILRSIVGRVCSVFSYTKWCNYVDKIANYSKSTKQMGFVTDSQHYFGLIFDKEDLLPIEPIEFENRYFFVPHNVDFYLKTQYGDYMTIPAEDKREKHYIKKIDLGGSSHD